MKKLRVLIDLKVIAINGYFELRFIRTETGEEKREKDRKPLRKLGNLVGIEERRENCTPKVNSGFFLGNVLE